MYLAPSLSCRVQRFNVLSFQCVAETFLELFSRSELEKGRYFISQNFSGFLEGRDFRNGTLLAIFKIHHWKTRHPNCLAAFLSSAQPCWVKGRCGNGGKSCVEGNRECWVWSLPSDIAESLWLNMAGKIKDNWKVQTNIQVLSDFQNVFYTNFIKYVKIRKMVNKKT